MNGLEWNKIAAAVLLSGLIAMVVGTVTDVLYAPKEAEKRGYEVEVAEEAAPTGGAPAEDPAKVDIAPFILKADAKVGEGIFKKCATCHSIEKGGPNKVGPNMWGVVGNHKAHLDNFAYSEVIKAMAAEGGKWGYQELSEFLYKPTAYAKGTKMAFAGIKKPEERAALIAYLNTMSDSPLPAPEVKEAPAAEDATQPAADQAEESLKKAGDKPKQEVELPATSKVPAGTESNSDQPKKEFPEEENSTEKEQNKDADKQGETEKKGE